MKAFQAKNRRIIKCIHETNPRKRADAAAAHDRSIFLKAKQKVEQSPGWRENRCKSRCKRRLFPVRVPVGSAATIDGWGWGGWQWSQATRISWTCCARVMKQASGVRLEAYILEGTTLLQDRNGAKMSCLSKRHKREDVDKRLQKKTKKKTTKETLALFFNLPGRQSYSINSIVDL